MFWERMIVSRPNGSQAAPVNRLHPFREQNHDGGRDSTWNTGSIEGQANRTCRSSATSAPSQVSALLAPSCPVCSGDEAGKSPAFASG
jgi:hypothetical protein